VAKATQPGAFYSSKSTDVELKCVEAIKGIHCAQVLTYLKAENLRVGLLINFNVDKLKEGIRRVIL
jgi:GxxExxY protein